MLGGGQLERQACVQVTKSLEDQGPWRRGKGCMLGNRYWVLWRLVGGKMETKVNKKVKTKESIRAREGNRFTNYPQRDYDYDELERRLTELKGGTHGQE